MRCIGRFCRSSALPEKAHTTLSTEPPEDSTRCDLANLRSKESSFKVSGLDEDRDSGGSYAPLEEDCVSDEGCESQASREDFAAGEDSAAVGDSAAGEDSATNYGLTSNKDLYFNGKSTSNQAPGPPTIPTPPSYHLPGRATSEESDKSSSTSDYPSFDEESEELLGEPL